MLERKLLTPAHIADLAEEVTYSLKDSAKSGQPTEVINRAPYVFILNREGVQVPHIADYLEEVLSIFKQNPNMVHFIFSVLASTPIINPLSPDRQRMMDAASDLIRSDQMNHGVIVGENKAINPTLKFLVKLIGAADALKSRGQVSRNDTSKLYNLVDRKVTFASLNQLEEKIAHFENARSLETLEGKPMYPEMWEVDSSER